MLILIVAGGPDKGRIYELLDGKDVVLGRDGDQVQLNDTKVSRQHAKLWCEGGRWYIQDLDSKHGTYRNHKKLEPNLQQPLKDGDYLQIGSTVLVLARMNGVVHQRPEMPGGNPVGALPLAYTSPASPDATPVPVGMSRKQQGLLIGGLAAAAALIVGVNVFTYLRANEQARALSEQLAALQNDPQRAALQTEVRDRLIEQSERAEAVAMALSKLTPEQAALRRELAGKLDGLTAAVQSDDDAKQVAGKLDEVLLAMRAQGGQQAALADRVLTALDAQPAKVAAAVSPVSPETVERLAAASEKLAGMSDLGEQIKQVRESIGDMPGEGGVGAELASMSQKLESFEQGNAQSRSDLLAAIDSVKQSMPADASSRVREQLDSALSKLDTAITKLDQTPTRDELTQQLAAAGKQQEVRLSQLALSIANSNPDGSALKDIQNRLETLASSVDSLKQQPGVTGSAASALAESTAQLRDQLGELAKEVRDRSTLADMGKQLADLNDRLGKVDTALGAFASADQLPKLREDLAKLASALPDRKDTQQLGQQLGDLAKSLETRGNDVQTLRDQLGQVARLVQEKADTSSLGEQLAMIQRALINREGIAAATMREQLAEIKKMLASSQGQPQDPQATAAIEKQLADIMTELKSRPDASLIKEQLEQLAAGKAAQPDPVLQQVLDAVKQRTQEQQAQQQRVDELLAKLENEPYVNRAMLDEALSAMPKAGDATPASVGAALDTDLLMAQVSSKLTQFMDQRGMVTADELRRVIRAEVVASLTANADILAEAIAEQGVLGKPAANPSPLNNTVLSKTEQAYKLAFETGKPVTLGAGLIDPVTGRPSPGKVLDPAAARAAGMTNWRDWYLWDDVSERMRLARETQNVRGKIGDPNVVALPAIEPPKE